MAGDVSNFNIKIRVDSKTGEAQIVEFGKSGKQAVEGIDRAAKSAGDSFLSFSNIIKGAGVAALGAMAVSAVKGAAELENYGVQFEVLTGSAEKGAALFKQIKEFGAATPFETKDLAAATQTMLGFNIAQEDVMRNLQMLGDISGGNAEKLKSLSLTFSQISSAGKLTGGDLLQMINAGFNPLTEISAMTGKSIAELRKEMEKGAISADMVKAAMARATGEGGKFNGMMEKQSKTFQGMLSTLQDTIGALLAEAGAPILELFKTLMPVITPVIEVLGKILSPIIKALAKLLEQLLPPFMKLIDEVFKILEPIIAMVVRQVVKLAPVFARVVEVAGKLLKALSPLIDVFIQLAEKYIEDVVFQLELIVEVVNALLPVINILAKVLSFVLSNGIKFIRAVINPIRDAILDIIKYGAQAIEFIVGIFGGGDDEPKKKPKTKRAEGGGGGGAPTGPQEGDMSPDGKSIWKGGKWVPLSSGSDGNKSAKDAAEKRRKIEEELSEKAKEIYSSMAESYRESVMAQLKADDELRDRRRANLDDYGSRLARANEKRHQDELAEMETADRVRGLKIANIADEMERETALFNYKLDLLYKEAIAEEELAEKKKAIEREYADAVSAIRARAFESGMSALESALGSLAELLNANFEEMKYVSVAQAIINTAVGVTKALDQGGWLGIAGAISVGLAGAAQVKKIMNTRPGSTGASAPTGLAQEGSAPVRGGMAPRRLNLSGTSVNVTGKLVAENGALVAVLQNDIRMTEGAGV